MSSKKANIALFIPHAGCPHRCSFCDQRAISGSATAPTPAEVTQTLTDAVAKLSPDRPAEIAFFGGSFTALPQDYMTALLTAAAPFIGQKGIAGIRVSTRPDAITSEILSILRTYGVTAVELGAQSMNDRVLSLNGRGHTARQVEIAAALIAQQGFSLGLQMMTGLYGSSSAEDRATAEKLLALRPNTMRIYPTVTLQNTRLEQLYLTGRYSPPTLSETVALCSELLILFESVGIPVIKLGLHAGAEPNIVAGPYHPALRELCESEIYFQKTKELLGTGAGEVTVLVHPGCLSKMIGQRRSNIDRLAALGWQVTVKGDASLLPHQIKIMPNRIGRVNSYVPEILGSTGLQVVSG